MLRPQPYEDVSFFLARLSVVKISKDLELSWLIGAYPEELSVSREDQPAVVVPVRPTCIVENTVLGSLGHDIDQRVYSAFW